MIPGDPAAVEAAARTLRQAGAGLADAAVSVGVHALDVTAEWTGDAADAALDGITFLGHRTSVGGDVCPDAATALEAYAAELRAAQAAWDAASSAHRAALGAQSELRASVAALAPAVRNDPDVRDQLSRAAGRVSGAAADMDAAVQREAQASAAAAAALDGLTAELAAMTARPPAPPTPPPPPEEDRPWWSDAGHLLLDGAGLIPVVGEPADLANAAWYGAEGDELNAGLSAAGAIPVAGWFATGGKAVNKGVQAADAASDAARHADEVAAAARAADAVPPVRRGLPDWLARIRAGSDWHRAQQARLVDGNPNVVTELHVRKPEGAPVTGQNNRVDAYDPVTQTITSMKHTQLAEVSPATARRYIDELRHKYAPGTQIAPTPTTPPGLVGRQLEGRMELLVPAQRAPVPPELVAYARQYGIRIRIAP
ncbi:hypothetical protein [Vallicoccus soli]|uniref:Uncharacterized protein n=1 Tax=Vallicoccus soli TaxID=2339232 RepID=A0A3A3Z3K5_9ACTN|nr:hypothetical protein [Vallicoccus soli]RJK97523.1 hypothetical protein D5H78_00285 [Vallicoccus soli]